MMVEEPLDVLVVEDNPGDVRLIKTGFAESGVEHSITHVSDGEKAFEYLYQRNGNEFDATPDLTMLDLNVPKVTGRDVLKRMNGDPDLASIPVLVLTGSRADTHVLETYRLGADGYFVKPVNPYEFISFVGTIANSVIASGTVPLGKYSEIDRGT